MRIGLDTFTLRDLKLDTFQTLDWLSEHGLEGAQFGGVRGLSPDLDTGHLKEIAASAAEKNLYCHSSVSNCNPHRAKLSPDEHYKQLTEEIVAVAECGWHELHTVLGGGEERYLESVPWTQQLDDSAKFLRRMAPVLREHNCRIDIETHGDVTTFELIRIIEDVGPDVVGICLDTANLLCHAEHPTDAARRAAPYVHLTHIKDGMITFTNRGYRRQTLPPGRGILAWQHILPILAEYSPNLPLSIEDHKWLFEFHAFEPQWLRLHPDLTREELASVMSICHQCEEKIGAGELPEPLVYEKIPYVDELEDRVHAGRDYLQKMVRKLGLIDCHGCDATRKTLTMWPEKS